MIKMKDGPRKRQHTEKKCFEHQEIAISTRCQTRGNNKAKPISL